MESFTYIIPPNDDIFKGMDTLTFDKQYNNPCWFSYDMDTARAYGPYLHNLKTTVQLKLINVMSPLFHDWFKGYLLDKFRHFDYDECYTDMMNLLIPLGLPNARDQADFLRDKYSINTQPSQEFTTFGKFVDYKSRASLHTLDIHLIQELKQYFSQYGFHGYIASSKWPSNIHGMFDDEICLFNISSLFADNSLIHVNVLQQRLRGGSSVKREAKQWIVLDPNYTWNDAGLHYLKSWGYDGPIEYDSNGKLITNLSPQQIRQYLINKRQETSIIHGGKKKPTKK